MSWPQNPGQICWHLDMPQPDRLVSVTVSQDHIMSQWTMVTSLKHPDMCSAIMRPNQCLWGDEWFQYNHTSESRKGKWRTSVNTPAGNEMVRCQQFPSTLLPLLPACPNFLSLAKESVAHTFFFSFFDNLTPISNPLFFHSPPL